MGIISGKLTVATLACRQYWLAVMAIFGGSAVAQVIGICCWKFGYPVWVSLYVITFRLDVWNSDNQHERVGWRLWNQSPVDLNPSMIYTGFSRKDFFHIFQFDGMVFTFSEQASCDISSWSSLAGDRKTSYEPLYTKGSEGDAWYLARGMGDKWWRHCSEDVAQFLATWGFKYFDKAKEFNVPELSRFVCPPSAFSSWLSELTQPTSQVACNLKHKRGEKRLTWSV